MWQIFAHADSTKSLFYAQKRGLYTGSKWRDWPVKTSEAEVLAWLLNLFEELQSRQSSSTFSDFPPSKLAKSGNLPLKHGDYAQKTDIVVVTRPIKTKNNDQEETHISWHNVRVIGKLIFQPGQCEPGFIYPAARKLCTRSIWQQT